MGFKARWWPQRLLLAGMFFLSSSPLSLVTFYKLKTHVAKTIALITEWNFALGQTACQFTLTPTSAAPEAKRSLGVNPIKTLQLYWDIEMSMGSFWTRGWMLRKMPTSLSFCLHSLFVHTKFPGNDAALRNKAISFSLLWVIFSLPWLRLPGPGKGCFLYPQMFSTCHIFYLILKYTYVNSHTTFLKQPILNFSLELERLSPFMLNCWSWLRQAFYC